MRIKATPEDFTVEEQIRLPLSESGGHTVFRIRKRDVTTLHVQERLNLSVDQELVAQKAVVLEVVVDEE